MTRSVKGRWAEHSGIGVKPACEFLGADQEEVSFEILLSKSLGANPGTAIKKLETAIEEDKALPFILNGKKIGDYHIESMEESWDEIILGGILYEASVNITLKEHADAPVQRKVTESVTKAETQSQKQEKASAQNYVVVKGDTLMKIAKKFYGDSAQYTKIYDANRDVIEARAKKDGKASSNGGYWIYPGTSLVIPYNYG